MRRIVDMCRVPGTTARVKIGLIGGSGDVDVGRFRPREVAPTEFLDICETVGTKDGVA